MRLELYNQYKKLEKSVKNEFQKGKTANRKDFKKVVHSDAPVKQAPDPRWAGELAKLKDLLANQKTPV